jgi:hypothetical protein
MKLVVKKKQAYSKQPTALPNVHQGSPNISWELTEKSEKKNDHFFPFINMLNIPLSNHVQQ